MERGIAICALLSADRFLRFRGSGCPPYHKVAVRLDALVRYYISDIDNVRITSEEVAAWLATLSRDF